MAEITKHARYARQADFDERLADGLINGSTICFIEDTRQIYVNGSYYTMDDAELAEKLGGYATKEELKAKQDTLTQGDNITIEGGVISAADTGATSVEASGESPLTLTASYNADTRKMTVGGSVDLSGYAKDEDLQRYLPLAGGTLTGDLTAKNIEMEELKAHTVYLDDTGSLLRNRGQTTLALTENGDAPSVVVADDDGKLYKTPVSEIGGDGKYLPLSGGTVTGSVEIYGGNLSVENMIAAATGNFVNFLETNDLYVDGTTRFYALKEMDDASYVIVTDSNGILYKAPVSSIAGPDMDAITDAEIDALF